MGADEENRRFYRTGAQQTAPFGIRASSPGCGHNLTMRLQALPLLPVLLLPVAVTAGEIYRCPQDGSVVYSDRPCAPGAQPMALPPAVVIPAGPSDDLLDQARQREQRDRQRTASVRDAEAQWQAQHAQEKADAERVQRARAQAQVVQGMTPADVRRIHGEPTVISRNRKAEGAPRETWSYLLEDGRVTVVFVDGKVSSVRSSQTRQ